MSESLAFKVAPLTEPKADFPKQQYETPVKTSHCPVEIRTQNWKKKVQAKAIESRRLRNRLALKGCTFCPALGDKPKPHGGMIPQSQKSYNQHIARMQSFRNHKLNLLHEAQSRPGSGIICSNA
eukprot:TRINITY_DN12080_c0_g3_i1.p1 TRINITY_DN12080_c0_g3~~TRINITY_DN12080_c0_g3_i1.p1  ORF type:complete len:124 (-),score=20.54 TRINITY_DN12080_c0_g3_i1:225-596(-)